MLQIDKRYLADDKIRTNSTVRSEVLVGVFIDKYIFTNGTLYVGTNPSEKLPDIHNNTNTVGFEVVNCEADVDFIHKDIIEKFAKINKAALNSTVEDNVYSTRKSFGHGVDWMVKKYKETLNKKLQKLNNGNYSGCSRVFLIILNILRANGMLNAKQIQQVYCEEIKNFSVGFANIYYITPNGIYLVNTNEVLNFKKFQNNEFSDCVMEMKQMLGIEE